MALPLTVEIETALALQPHNLQHQDQEMVDHAIEADPHIPTDHPEAQREPAMMTITRTDREEIPERSTSAMKIRLKDTHAVLEHHMRTWTESLPHPRLYNTTIEKEIDVWISGPGPEVVLHTGIVGQRIGTTGVDSREGTIVVLIMTEGMRGVVAGPILN